MPNTRRTIHLLIALFWLAATFLAQPAQAYALDWRDLSADLDGDGLPNVVEENGWYNEKGGPFLTNYMDSDSDDDGLTDGQEKLFDTDPLNDRSPGIFVVYRDDFQTKQYFPWQRYGNHYIAMPASGQNAVVVRRGTTFSVGGPADANLIITPSIGSLTTLTPARDICGGGWTVNVPAGGTVGIYTLETRAPNGSLIAQLNLYVIFQLPTDVSTAFKNDFVYDDNPDSDRDTTSIGYWEGGEEGSSGWRQTEYTHDDYAWIPEGEWISRGYTWGFRTQHYDAFVFEAQVMPAINGKSNTWNAADALGARVDELTCTNWPNPLGSSYCVMNPGSCFPFKLDNQCTNIANLLTAFNRSAGIPSRPMWTDWVHSTFDHSTEVWSTNQWGSTRWYVMKGYAQREGNPCTTARVTGGFKELRNTSGYYSGDSSQGVYAVGEGWYSIGGSSEWADKFRMASWDLDRVARTGKIVKRDWFESRFMAYWSWPSEPQVTGTPPNDWPTLPPPPVAGFTASPTSGVAPLTVNFTDQSTGHIRTWAWNFGDGGTSAEQNPSYTYTTAGTFTVSLTVTGAGGSNTRTRTGYIHVAEPLMADFSGSPRQGTAPLTVNFTDLSTGGATSWSWNFGDGHTSSAQNPSHNYTSTGDFTVSLTVTGNGDSDTETKAAYIQVAASNAPTTFTAATNPAGDPDAQAAPDALVSSSESEPAVTAIPAASSTGPVIQFGQVLADYATDLDGDGRFDELVFEFQVDVAQAGEYWIRAKLAEGLIETVGNTYLEPGSHTLALAFDGRDIYMNQVDGPFTLDGLWATDVTNPVRADFGEHQLAYARLDYQSSFYRFSDFGLTGARLSGSYQDTPVDADADGYADALIVETDLNIERPDTYTVQGLLFDGGEELISEATWTGSGPRVTLQFEGLRGTRGPYTLQHIHVRDAAGEVTDGMKDAYALGERPEFNARPISLGAEKTVTPFPFLPNFGIRTDGYSDAGVDTDGDGRFDQLVITVGVDVEPAEAGQPYRIEGWLVDGNNALISWAVSDSKVLTTGVQSLALAFDGRVINEHGVDGPFTLVALKALAGDAYDVLDAVNVAHTTSAYNHDQFEGAVVAPAVDLFHDNMESGGAQWVAASPWELNTNAWHGYSHAWEADASGTLNGALSTIPLDVSDYANPALRFNTCYEMISADDAGYLEVSTNGVDWTRVTSYTNATTHWTPQLLQLGDVGETPNFQLRFNADSESGLLWYVDDVSLAGWPAVTAVSFTHSPQPVLVGQDVTFEGSYSSIASTPVTYTWDFGDGSPPMVTYTPAISHQFPAWDDYDVQLTIENPYDATTFSQIITAYQPVTATSFSFGATDPANDRQAVFTATYAPTSATQPVTYTWDFDDGSDPVVTASAVVTHEFPANANYNVALAAYNGYGSPATYQDVVRTPLDDDRDNIPNGVEGTDDADGDGTPNYLDLDADGDTIRDSAEAGDTDLNTPPVDTDDDETPDYLDLDADGDTIRDSAEAGDADLNTPPVDTDDDGTPDFQDLDADGDDIPDRTEAGDSNPNTPPVDTDDDGTPDFVDSDADNDGITDAGEWSTGSGDPLAGCTADDPVCTDNDADDDGTPNYRDTDSDDDGGLDLYEGPYDFDGDGIPAYLDIDVTLGPEDLTLMPLMLR
jgi:PKD repeat protein